MNGVRFLFMLIFVASVLSGCAITVSQTVAPPAPTSVPLPWAGLGLRGKLVYTSSKQDENPPTMDIRLLDLANGQVTTLFQTPPAGMLYSVAVSPDQKQMILAYSLPPGVDQTVHQWLYQMPLDGSAPPKLLFTPPTPDDQYGHPEWSPDGKFIYFAHVNYQRPTQKGQQFPFYELYRIAYPSGQPEKLVDEAHWPRLSPDMSRLAYITLDPITGKNKLFLANVDGSDPVAVPLTGDAPLDIMDAPLFSPDAASLLFSVPVPENVYQPASPTWVEKIFGVSIASAHALPSDWWSVPLKGGTATQLTQIQAIGLFGSLSPDQKNIASYSGNGIFVMNPDGTGLTMLIKDVGGLPGTVSWIP